MRSIDAASTGNRPTFLEDRPIQRGEGAENFGRSFGENFGRNGGKNAGKTPEQILAALAATLETTLADLALSIGKSLSAVERAAAKLVKEKRLRFVGPWKGGRWEVMP